MTLSWTWGFDPVFGPILLAKIGPRTHWKIHPEVSDSGLRYRRREGAVLKLIDDSMIGGSLGPVVYYDYTFSLDDFDGNIIEAQAAAQELTDVFAGVFCPRPGPRRPLSRRERGGGEA